jgi:hypothetical protein
MLLLRGLSIPVHKATFINGVVSPVFRSGAAQQLTNAAASALEVVDAAETAPSDEDCSIENPVRPQ